MIGKQHVHAEATGDTCRSLPEGTLPDDAHGCAVEIANRVVEEAELIDLLPPATLNVPAVSEQIATYRRDQRERVFGNGMHRIVANVSYRDAIRLAIGNIDDIVAGCSYCDHFELRQALQRLGPQRHFVGDGDGCVTHAFRQIVRRRDRVFLPRVLKSGTPDLRLQCGAIQEYNAMRHAGTRMTVVGLLRDRISSLCITPVWIRSSGPRRTALPG